MNQRYLCAMQEAAVDTVQFLASDSVGFVSGLDSIDVTVLDKPTESLFHDHLLQTTDLTWLERIDTGNTFVFVLIAICGAILIYLQKNSEGIFSSVFKATVDRNLAMQEARVENSQRTRNRFLLLVVGGTSISLFLASVGFSKFQISGSFSAFYFKVLGLLLLMFGIKRIVLFGISFLFDLHQELKIHSFNQNLLHSMAGLLLLPVSLLMFYNSIIPSTWLVTMGLLVAGLFYLQGLLRGMQLAVYASRISLLHLFYYLCALEILPVFVLIRLVQGMQ
jgi:hypothetical protein